jgi:hypothetical protein
MKTTQALFLISIISFVTFQNCGGNKVAFSPVEDTVEQSQSVDPQPENGNKEIEIEFKDKDLSFYGTRINGHLALVATLNEPSTLPLTISLKKACGSIDDAQIAGNGQMGKFIFSIPAGQKESAPVILSAFPTGQIVWSVQINVTGSNAPVTDVLQTCSPWLQSGGGNLCPSPTKQPYCIDRGA